jgi:hypothetical protein
MSAGIAPSTGAVADVIVGHRSRAISTFFYVLLLHILGHFASNAGMRDPFASYKC